MLLVRNADVYAPEHLGLCDFLAANGRIVALSEGLELPRAWDVRIFDADGAMVIPGLVDQHIHMSGGGGGGGPATSNPPLEVGAALLAGITTAVGCLGYETGVVGMGALLKAVRVLRHHGFDAYYYCGGIQFPPPTILESVERDVSLMSECLGVKVAVADDASSLRQCQDLVPVATDVLAGARAGGQPPIIHVHVGKRDERMALLMEAVESHGVPASLLVVTHVNWNDATLAEAAALAKAGAVVDVTAALQPSYYAETVAPDEAVMRLRELGAPPGRITMSSDSNGSTPVTDELGRIRGVEDHPPSILWAAVARLIDRVPSSEISEMISVVTHNPARALGLYPSSGGLGPGSRADVLVVDDALSISTVILQGEIVVDGGRLLRRGYFEV